MTARSTQHPPTMMSARSRGSPGLCTRSASRSVASVRNTSSAAARVSTKRCSASRSYSARPISTAAIVVIVPPMPTSVAASTHGGQLAQHVVEVGVDERERVAQLLGRGRIGVQLLLGEADAADRDRHGPVERRRADRQLGRAATDVEHQERPERLVELARRAEERKRPSSTPSSTSIGDPEHLGSPGREVSAVGRLAHGLGRDRAHPASPVRLDEVAVLGEHLERAGDAVGVERPGAVGRSTRAAVTAIRRSSATEPAFTSRRIEFVPQSTTATGRAERRHYATQLDRDPSADGIVEPGEMRGVVRVEALHALPGASDAAGGSRTVVTGRDGRVTLGRVRARGPPRGRPRSTARSAARTPPARLEPAHGFDSRPSRPASSAWAWACRRRAAARCGSRSVVHPRRVPPPRTDREELGRGAR